MFILESQVRILIKFSRFIIVNYFIFFPTGFCIKNIFHLKNTESLIYEKK
nr:MAG TPA: hypothetical protein [Bacteriophage sp.]